MFTDYKEYGPSLLGTPDRYIRASFRFKNTNVTIANTLRRAILTLTPSVGFRTEPYEKSDVQIITNTTPLVNEMISHRIGMIPIHVSDIVNFQPQLYEFVLDKKNTTKQIIDVYASDFKVFKRSSENPLEPPVELNTNDYFPPDPITGSTILITRLRPRWNPTAPEEQLTLKAKASVSNGVENIRWSPVCKASYEYTRSSDPEKISRVFTDWLRNTKKIADLAGLSEVQRQAFQREFDTMEIQRCYETDEKGNPNDFTFHIESVGVQTIDAIVRAGIAAAEALVSKYQDIDQTVPSNIQIVQGDSRFPSIDIIFTNEGHTLGNLLETYIVENHIDGTEEPKVQSVGYKVPHPLRPEMFIRLGVLSTDDFETQKKVARNVVGNACRRLKQMFRDLGTNWNTLHSVA